MTRRRVVVLTGATGFIGSAVLRALTAHEEHPRVRTLTRRPLGPRAPSPDTEPDSERIRADLADPASLGGVCAGADVLISLASCIGPDERECALVNDEGTAALMGEAERAGVRRIVHLSTTAVYGAGPHRGADVGDLVPAPLSPTSRTRLAGERHALDAGALVLRAGLVTGPGDRWVVPALADLTRRVPAYWDHGRGRASLIAVEDLARLIVRAALHAPADVRGVYHAVHPEPVRTRDLLDTLAAHGVLPRLTEELGWEESLALLRRRHGRVSERQFALLAGDHFYRGEPVWRRCACDPGPGPLARLGKAADWYRGHLAPGG